MLGGNRFFRRLPCRFHEGYDEPCGGRPAGGDAQASGAGLRSSSPPLSFCGAAAFALQTAVLAGIAWPALFRR